MERKKNNNWGQPNCGATYQPSGKGGGGDDGPSLSRGTSLAIYSDKTRTRCQHYHQVVQNAEPVAKKNNKIPRLS